MRKSETLFCSLRDFPSVKIYEFKASIFIQSYVQQYSKNKNKIEIVGSAIKLQICISLTLKKKRCIVSCDNIPHRMKLMLLIFFYSLYRYVIKKIILSKTRNFFLLFHHRVCKNQEVHTVYMWCWESRYFPINSSSQILSLRPLCIGGNNGLPIIKKPKRERETERQKQHQLRRKLLLPATFLIINSRPCSDGLNKRCVGV